MDGAAAGLRAAILEKRGVLRIAGPEARPFLQGLVTNDMDRVDETQAIYAALLTPQGKFLFDFFIAAETSAAADPGFLLDCDGARATALLHRLTFYKLRAQVTLEDVSGTFGVAALWGDGAAAQIGLNAGAHEGMAVQALDGTVFVDPRLAAMGVRALLPRTRIADTCREAGFAIAEATDYHRHRLALGVPDAALDLEPEKSFPLEANFDDLQAIAFQKGCFVGQEVTSRTKRRGRVRKRLLPVRVEGDLPRHGTPVRSIAREIGKIYSGAGDRALALLRLDLIGDGELEAGDARLFPEVPAWASFSLEETTEEEDGDDSD